MSTSFPYFLSRVAEESHALRRNWFWFLLLGILLIVAGTLAIMYPVLATLASVEVFGYLLVFGGAVEVVSAFWAGRWGGFFLHLLGGLLYLFIGAVLIERPGLGAAGYTLMLAVFFVAAGLFRIVFALGHRFSAWGWTLLSGVITLLLGILVWRQWPASALWVIGTFVGIELIFSGWSWVMLGLAVRKLPAARVTADPTVGRPVV
jgi:uncharacterized membrane protein HdeD (DUF308 family)